MPAGHSPVEPPRPELTFAFPNDQRITAGRSGGVEQTGRDVVIRPVAGAAGLAPGASVPVTLTGTYAQGNALPTRFELDGVSCEVQVKSLTNAPLPAGVPDDPAAVGGGGGSGDPVTEARSGGKASEKGSGKGSDKGDGRGHGKRT
jgi:Cellulose binding domain